MKQVYNLHAIFPAILDIPVRKKTAANAYSILFQKILRTTTHEIFSDPETMVHYPTPFDEACTPRSNDRSLENYAKYGFELWVVVLKEMGEFSGDYVLLLSVTE